jgi:autotransporter translocation and assembly factor TamB
MWKFFSKSKTSGKPRWRRRLALAALVLLFLTAALGSALYFYLDSDQFREQTRRLVEETLRRQTGADVSLGQFAWDLGHRKFLLENVVLRGSEPRDGPPLARIERVEAGVQLRDLVNRRAHLSELIIERPHILLIVDADGKTNIPALASRSSSPSSDLDLDFSIAIDEFKIIGGEATINARPIAIDFAVTKLNSALRYRSNTGALSGQLRFDGVAEPEGRAPISYTAAGSFDYTAGSLLAHGIELKSGEATGNAVIKAQGRIDRALTPDFQGQLEYTAAADARLLHYLLGLEKERIEAKADLTGRLTFSRESFSTSGAAAAPRAVFNEWTATAVKAQYTYAHPARQLTLNPVSFEAAGGAAEGSVILAGASAGARATIDIRYHDLDSAELERLYPWDPQYRVYSKLDGVINGWVEGRFERYDLKGNAQLTAYPPKAIPETVALPLDGQGAYAIRPGNVTVTGGQARFFATTVEADGAIGSEWNMKVKLTSSDLRNLFFIHREANGAGSFSGTLTGPLKQPVASGAFDVTAHHHKEWTIERIAGTARVDTGAGTANLTGVQVTEGASSITVSGTVALNGESADLQVESSRLTAEDAAKFDRRLAGRLEGVFSGTARLTSLAPLRAEGDIKARDLVIDKRPLGEAQTHFRYAEPTAELTSLSVRRGAAAIAGSGSYNTQDGAIAFDVTAQSIDLETVRDLGVPAGIAGVVERGRFSGSGPPDRISIEGKEVRFREAHGAVVTGDLAYAAPNETVRFDVNVTALNLDTVRNAWSELKIPASLAGTLVERGSFSGSGPIRAIAVTGKGVTIRESHGATVSGDMAYNVATEALSFDVNLSALKFEVVRNILRDLGRDPDIPASIIEGGIVERGRFVGKGTARQPSVTGTNITIRDGHGATATGELAYNASADTLTFDANVASLGLARLNDLRPDLGIPASLLNGMVLERAHVSASGSATAPVVTVKDVTVHEKGGAALTGEFAYNVGADKLSFVLNVATVSLDALREFGIPQNLTGTVERGRFSGEVIGKQPNIEGSATLRNLTFSGEEFATGQLAISRSSGSKLAVKLDAGAINLSAEIDTAAKGYPFTGSGSFVNYPVERLARLRGETLRLTGKADRLEGLLTDVTQLRGSGRIESAEMLVQGRQLKSTKPFTFDFTRDRATFSGISLASEGTALNVEGTVSLNEKETLDLRVNGTVALDLLTAGTDWPASGELGLNGRIGGTVQDRDLFGLATFKNASVAPKGFFGTISNLNGDVFFDGATVRFDQLTGTIGGGKVQVQGEATLGKEQIESMNARIVADSVVLRYPEGFRTVTDGVLILRGSWVDPLLEGNLQIRSMSYQGQFEQFLALLGTPGIATPAESLMSRLNLSIHVEGNRNITIKNELTDAQARVSLDIRGTVGSPSLTGHVEARGGTLLFQGKQYEITRGNIDFVNPFVIEPVVDVQAEAEMRNYRVILGVTGRGDKLRFEMRSDPALPELEVFSLVTGGKTREELLESDAARAGGVTGEQLFPTAAAAVLTDILKSRVGGSLGLLGLERFRIDPLPIGSARNALARITVPIQVSKDLLITYSQDLSSAAQQILQIEYFVSKDLSILATRDENGALSLDVKRRQKF